jgi:hypothetical protein
MHRACLAAVLVRPSYVLSGAAMNVAYSKASLEKCIGEVCKPDTFWLGLTCVSTNAAITCSGQALGVRALT